VLAYQLSAFKVSVLGFVIATTIQAFLKSFRKAATYKVCQYNLSKQSETGDLREESGKLLYFLKKYL